MLKCGIIISLGMVLPERAKSVVHSYVQRTKHLQRDKNRIDVLRKRC